MKSSVDYNGHTVADASVPNNSTIVFWGFVAVCFATVALSAVMFTPGSLNDTVEIAIPGERSLLMESKPQYLRVYKDNEVATYRPQLTGLQPVSAHMQEIKLQMASLEQTVGDLRQSNAALQDTIELLKSHPPRPLRERIADLDDELLPPPAKPAAEAEPAIDTATSEPAAKQPAPDTPQSIIAERPARNAAPKLDAAETQAPSQLAANETVPTPRPKAAIINPEIATLPAPEIAPEVYENLPAFAALVPNQTSVTLPDATPPQLVASIPSPQEQLEVTSAAGIVYGRAGSVFTRSAFAVDLGSYEDREEAENILRRAEELSTLIDQVGTRIRPGKPTAEQGILYQALAGPFANARDSVLACAQIKGMDATCRTVIHPK
ncbi:hypothetical protein [Pseudovibrio sp. SPO723]|uniref:SPOR domain-containing protein n=1 Tax=Nesiotobacter zosterae TaxID=392721 RepID=UPI0029C17810|nr:hypothetical protein [Pseudovibrio sp. SPO723]MDX5592766.1 hypothetical protein [Pseudovibrio sp. SPO723]